MKIGLAENQPPRLPSILVLGEGALAEQIKNDFLELGLHAQLVGGEQSAYPLPKVTDFDAKGQFEALFKHWVGETGAEWPVSQHVWKTPIPHNGYDACLLELRANT